LLYCCWLAFFILTWKTPLTFLVSQFSGDKLSLFFFFGLGKSLSLHFVKHCLVRYNIYCWHFVFNFSTLNISFCCLLAYKISAEKFNDGLVDVPSEVMIYFYCFQNSLSLTLQFDYNGFWYRPCWVLLICGLTSWIWVSVFLSRFWKISTSLKKNFHSFCLFLLSPYDTYTGLLDGTS
jgi:hypothetical protein